MRSLLRRIGARTGISLALVLVVAVTVLVARLVDDRPRSLPHRPPDFSPGILETEGDDSADDEEPTDYPDDEVVLAVASVFATEWLRSDRAAHEWLDGLRPHCTEALIDRLADVDPSEVPANATLGEPTIRARTETHAEVAIPIAPHDALVLGLARTDDGWLAVTLDRETG